MPERQQREPQKPSQGRIRSRWQRENRRRRSLLLGGLVLIFLILAIPAYGYYDSFVVPPRQTVVKVNGESYNMGHVLKLLRVAQRSSEAQGQPLSLGTLPFQVVQNLAESALIRQGASRYNITVTNAEIDTDLRQRFLGATTGQETSPEELNREFQERYRQFLNLVQLSDGEEREIVRDDLYREKLREQLGREVERIQPQVHLYSIQIPPESSALELADEIRTEYARGTPFAELVARPDLNQDPEDVRKGGEFGWLPRGIAEQLDELLFEELEPCALPKEFKGCTLAEPLPQIDAQSGSTGYIIYLVRERSEARELEEQHLEALTDRALEAWLVTEREANDLQITFNSDRYEWISEQMKLSAARP